jgi:hypothetical protein
MPSIDTRVSEVLKLWKNNGENPGLPHHDMLDLRTRDPVNKYYRATNSPDKVSTLKGKPPANRHTFTEKDPMPGLLHSEKKKIMVWAKTGRAVFVKGTQIIEPQCHSVVTLAFRQGQKLEHKNNSVLIQPKQTSAFLNKHGLFVHPGAYKRVGDNINVLITNFGKMATKLPAHVKVGRILEGIAYEAPTLNVLDHRDPATLSPKEKAERREYIQQHLKLSVNPLLKNKPLEQEKLIQIFLQNWEAISVSDTDYGRTEAMKFQIALEPGAAPAHSRVRPLNPHQEADLKRQLDEWEKGGIIEKSMSPWASALVPCKKKGSTALRWAVDYRKVNELTIKDRFPLNSIDSNLHKLGGSTVFSCLDAIGAFHSLVVEEKSRDITSFVSPFGSYRFVRLPFGLSNAPSAYSRLVQMALDQLPCGFTLAYIDDVIIHSKTSEEHLDHVEQVLKLHAKFGMKLRLNKCHMFQTEVEYLGHMVSKEGIRMIPSYVDRILAWELPTTGKELRTFLGFTGYYRSFIKEYSFLTAEMNKAKQDNYVDWDDKMKGKFKTLKYKFQTGPVRGYPDYKNPEPFIVDTDFSAVNMAAVLSQKQDGKEVFLGCVAQKCNKAQQSYASHKGELCAVALGLQRFEHILRYRPFIVRTDSSCLKYLNTMKEYRGMFARIQAFLAGFEYKVVHRSGTLQRNADALSRMRGLKDTEEDNIETDGHMKDVEDLYHVAEEVTLSDVQKAVQEDGVLSKIRDYVKAKHKPDKEERKTLTRMGVGYVNIFERLSVKEGVVYYKAPEVNGIRQPNRICLPLTLQDLAFRLCHNHETMGHYGVVNTFNRMRARFHFPHMFIYVEGRVLNCINCVTKKSNRPKGTHEMHRERLSYFGQRVYTDTVKLSLSPRMFQGKLCKYILTIQDGWSRYLQAVPVPSEDAETIARALVENWVYTFGCPEVLHSDRGSAYTSKLFKEVMAALNILKTVTPAYSPEGDRVERSHQVLGNLLRADHQHDPTNWTAKLPVAVFAYNTARNRMTGLSPYEAVFGQAAVMPVDLIFPLQREEGVSWSKYVQELRGKYQRIMEKTCKAQDTALHINDPVISGRRKAELKEGDTVYWFLPRVEPGQSSKLQRKWIGPFTIRKVVSDSLIIIYPTGTWAKHPREVPTITSRVRKIDPAWMDPSSRTRRYIVDLDNIRTEWGDGTEENIEFGNSREDENEEIVARENPVGTDSQQDLATTQEDPDPAESETMVSEPDQRVQGSVLSKDSQGRFEPGSVLSKDMEPKDNTGPPDNPDFPQPEWAEDQSGPRTGTERGASVPARQAESPVPARPPDTQERAGKAPRQARFPTKSARSKETPTGRAAQNPGRKKRVPLSRDGTPIHKFRRTKLSYPGPEEPQIIFPTDLTSRSPSRVEQELSPGRLKRNQPLSTQEERDKVNIPKREIRRSQRTIVPPDLFGYPPEEKKERKTQKTQKKGKKSPVRYSNEEAYRLLMKR